MSILYLCIFIIAVAMVGEELKGKQTKPLDLILFWVSEPNTLCKHLFYNISLIWCFYDGG